VGELAELGEVAAHQSEVVLVVETPDPPDAVESLTIAELDPERVAGVRGVGDEPIVAEQLDDLADRARLRIDRMDVVVARHRD
jgi:hypothetical protein